MKIGIDARKIGHENNLGNFVEDYIQNINKSNEYYIFVDENFLFSKTNENITFLKTNLKNSLLDEIKFGNILKTKKLDLMIFFDASIPINYFGKYFTYPWAFEKIVYSDSISRKNKIILEYKLKKSHKIICFSETQKYDLNENLGISLEKISIEKPIFRKINNTTESKINLDFDYILIDINSDIEILKKIFIVINRFYGLKIILAGKNKFSENLVKTEIKDSENIIFTDYSEEIVEKAKMIFYAENDNIFPFGIFNFEKYKEKILAPKNKILKELFGEQITYYSSISTSGIETAIKNKL